MNLLEKLLLIARVLTPRLEVQYRAKELKFSLKMMRRAPLSMVGIGIIATYGMIAILSPVLAPPPDPYRPFEMLRHGFSSIPRTPAEVPPFGTTDGQFDIYYGVIWGTRTAFQISFVIVGTSLLVGLMLGSTAGYYGGKIDEVLMRITDIILAFPALVLALAFTLAFGRSLESVVQAIILVNWPIYARLIRGEVLAVKQEDYVEAAKAIGASDFRVTLRHILPNSIFPVLVYASLDVGSIVVLAAALSFLGIGTPVGYADWGQLINLSRNWIIGPPNDTMLYWHTYAIPGLFLALFVMGWSLIGDAFRDILDPRLRRR